MEKKVLITWGGWDGHEPEQCSAIFHRLLEADGCRVDRVNTLDVLLDLPKLKEYDLIVPVWTMSKIGKEEFSNLREAVSAGTGMAGWHGGMGDAFRENTDYQWMVGGQWVAHPGGVIDYTVEIIRFDPITDGLRRSFPMHSEQYYMHTDPGNEVLAVTVFDGSRAPWVKNTVMPVAWKRYFGNGKIFYSSLGHVAKDFDVPEARIMMFRGMKWAMR